MQQATECRGGGAVAGHEDLELLGESLHWGTNYIGGAQRQWGMVSTVTLAPLHSSLVCAWEWLMASLGRAPLTPAIPSPYALGTHRTVPLPQPFLAALGLGGGLGQAPLPSAHPHTIPGASGSFSAPPLHLTAYAGPGKVLSPVGSCSSSWPPPSHQVLATHPTRS